MGEEAGLEGEDPQLVSPAHPASRPDLLPSPPTCPPGCAAALCPPERGLHRLAECWEPLGERGAGYSRREASLGPLPSPWTAPPARHSPATCARPPTACAGHTTPSLRAACCCPPSRAQLCVTSWGSLQCLELQQRQGGHAERLGSRGGPGADLGGLGLPVGGGGGGKRPKAAENCLE